MIHTLLKQSRNTTRIDRIETKLLEIVLLCGVQLSKLTIAFRLDAFWFEN